jgi:hypothetical protein
VNAGSAHEYKNLFYNRVMSSNRLSPTQQEILLYYFVRLMLFAFYHWIQVLSYRGISHCRQHYPKCPFVIFRAFGSIHPMGFWYWMEHWIVQHSEMVFFGPVDDHVSDLILVCRWRIHCQ